MTRTPGVQHIVNGVGGKVLQDLSVNPWHLPHADQKMRVRAGSSSNNKNNDDDRQNQIDDVIPIIMQSSPNIVTVGCMRAGGGGGGGDEGVTFIKH